MSKRTRRSTVGRSHAWFQTEPAPENWQGEAAGRSPTAWDADPQVANSQATNPHAAPQATNPPAANSQATNPPATNPPAAHSQATNPRAINLRSTDPSGSMPLPPSREALAASSAHLSQGERAKPLPTTTTVKVRTSAARLRRALTRADRQVWEGRPTDEPGAEAWAVRDPAVGAPMHRKLDSRGAVRDRRLGSWEEPLDDWDQWADPRLEVSEPAPTRPPQPPPPRSPMPESYPSTVVRRSDRGRSRTLVNGFWANGSGANGVGANGSGANGVGANSFGANGVGANSFGANGSGVNRAPGNRVPVSNVPGNRVPASGVPVSGAPDMGHPQAGHLMHPPSHPVPVMAPGHPMAQHDWGTTVWEALQTALRSPWWGAIAPVGAAALLLASPLMWQQTPPAPSSMPAIATTLGCMGDAPNPNSNGQLTTRQLEHLKKLIGQTQGSVTSQLGESYCDLPRVAMRSGAILERRAYLHNNQPVVLGFETERLIGYRHGPDPATTEGRSPTHVTQNPSDHLEIDLKQNWGIAQGSTMAGHRVIGGLGGLSIASDGPVYAPVAGTVYRQITFITNGQLSQGSEDCVVLGSDQVPAYLVQLCGVSRPQTGPVTAGQRVGRATGYLHVAVLRQDGAQWMFVPPAPELFEPLLSGKGAV